MSSVNGINICPRCGQDYEYVFDCNTSTEDRISSCKCDLIEEKLRGTIKILRKDLSYYKRKCKMLEEASSKLSNKILSEHGITKLQERNKQ